MPSIISRSDILNNFRITNILVQLFCSYKYVTSYVSYTACYIPWEMSKM